MHGSKVPQHPTISTCFMFLIVVPKVSHYAFWNPDRFGKWALVIRVSTTICCHYNPAFPSRPCGACYPIDYVVVAPGTWVCVGFSDSAPEGLFDGWVWYHGRDLHWFGIGSEPIAVWRDAVVLATTISDRFVVVPDKLYTAPIPRRFCIQHCLMGWVLPSVWKKVSKAWKQEAIWLPREHFPFTFIYSALLRYVGYFLQIPPCWSIWNSVLQSFI